MKIAIIGAGLIGNERIVSVKECSKIDHNISISSVFDTDNDKLSNLKNKFQISTTNDLNHIWQHNPDWVFICTPHDIVKPLIEKAFQHNINVLVEKPLGRNLQECEDILKNKPENCKLHIGFNYRFFDGIEAALKDCRENKFGKLISVNLILGHGNSPGMEKSWKLDPIKCGGGCLIDPGVHVLDLILQISAGNTCVKNVMSWSGFWNTGIEEEAHLLLSDSNNTIFNAQISLNKWKSSFKLEINGTEGYGIVEGRGRSYGPQSYRTGVRWGWQTGTSQLESETVVVYNNNCENSFIKETQDVLGLSNNVSCNHIEAMNIMKLLQECQIKNKG